MKHLVPSLRLVPTAAACALMGAVPAFGASIADDLVIKPKVQVQVRAQVLTDGTNTNGDDFNVFNGGQGDTEKARFSVRRARFGAEAKNSTGWEGVFQIRAGEKSDAGARSTYVTGVNFTAPGSVTTADLTNNKTRTAELYNASVAKTFKSDDLEQKLTLGLQKPFNGESSISSSRELFPSIRPVAQSIEYRDVGLQYLMTAANMVRFGVDVQNGRTTLSPDTDSSPAGLFYSARVEFAPSAEWMPATKTESWAGQEGKHLLVGFDYQRDSLRLTSVSNNITGNDARTTVATLGPDVLFHLDGLTALAEMRYRFTKVDNSVGVNPEDVRGQIWALQVGYALPLESGLVIEPALRFGTYDINKVNENEGPNPYTGGEFQGDRSGTEYGVAFNLYWNGHANKTQIAYNSWKGEESLVGDSAKAHTVTLQQQVTF